MMYRALFILLAIVSALEILLFIFMAKKIGFLLTILLLVLMTAAGAWLAKKEGLHTYRLLQLQLSRGEIPSGVFLDGVCILAGGLLLLFPGFLTDVFGLLLLVPITRTTAKAFLLRWFERKMFGKK